VLLLPAVLYALTLFPGVGGRGNTGDSAKFQYIGEVLGVPHQPGYPQYVVLNFLFTRLPLPLELATEVNLLSAVFALAAGAFLFLFFRELGGRSLPAALATWTVLLAQTVWSYSTEAEVYSLHLLWVAAVSWALCIWTRERTRRRLILLLVLYAFSFGNHPTMITLLPGMAVVLFSLEGRKLFERRLVAITLTAIALSLGQYGYVLWRSHSDAPFVEGIGREADLSRLAESVRGDRFARKNLLGKGEGELIGRITGVPLETVRQLGPVALVFSIFGLVAAFRRREPLRWYLILGVLGPAAFVAAYHVGDWQAYLTPAWVMLAGLAALCVGRMFQRRVVRAIALVLWALLLALVGTVNFRSLRVLENEYDRSLLVAAAGRDAQLVTYRGPGYKAKQLNNYYRLGLRLEEERNLAFLTAKEAFEEQFAFLEERPLYFRDKRVKRFFDRHQVDYVQRWQNEDPLSSYFVTGARWPLDEVAVVADNSGTLRIRSSEEHYLTDGVAPIEIAVVDGRTRRARGVAPFTFADGWTEDKKRLGLVGFTDKIAHGDWFFVTAQGSSVRVNPATLARLAAPLGFAPSDIPRPRGSIVLAGRKGVPETLLAIADPERPITVPLRPEMNP
jgi:hypothetical protein